MLQIWNRMHNESLGLHYQTVKSKNKDLQQMRILPNDVLRI